MENNKIFISHSSKDIVFIDSFVDQILKLALEIPADRIFCSSKDGHGIKNGKYIPNEIKNEIKKSCFVILFISKNYRESEVCLNELGAAWVLLEESRVIPILLPDVDFKDLGFLDTNRLALRVNVKSDLEQFVEDNKIVLQSRAHLQVVNRNIAAFLSKISDNNPPNLPPKIESDEVKDWIDCFQKHLNPFNEIITKAIPTYSEGIYKIEDLKIQSNILTYLSESDFLKSLLYIDADGDSIVDHLRKLHSGNWVFSMINKEFKISSFWVSTNLEMQNDFILIQTETLSPFKINSDIGGEDYCVGVLNDGTVVSRNEYLNSYAIINGESIDLGKLGVESRARDSKPHWIFFVSTYHKAGFDRAETIKFCEKLDNGEVEANSRNLKSFLRSLRNHPTVVIHR